MNPIGIAEIQNYLPAQRCSVNEMALAASCSTEEIIKRAGVLEKPIAQLGETPIQMGLKAANNLLSKIDVDLNLIRFVIFSGYEANEKRLWSPAAKIQNELGLKEALAFDISNGCNGGNLGLNVAASLLQSSRYGGLALLIVSETLSSWVDYTNREHISLFNFADAATAVLISTEAARSHILSFAAVTQPEFVDCLSISLPNKRVDRFVDSSMAAALSKAYETNYPRVIRDACTQAGIAPSNLRRIFINQGNPGLIDRIANNLSIADQLFYRTHDRFGHLGSSDIFVGLQTSLEKEELQYGDIVALASSAAGFSWGCSIIRI